MKRFLAVLSLAAMVSACGSSPTTPTPAPVVTPPVAATFSLSGTVTSTAGGGIAGATVRIVDGANAGKSTTTAAGGSYSFTGLAIAGQTVSASATNYGSVSKGVSTTSNQTLDFQLTPTPLFSRAGTGDTVFDMPTTVSRIRITGSFNGNSSNFIVHIGGRGVVNELLGTFWGPLTFDGTYVTVGGVTEILNSSGVSWTFTEVR